MKHNLDVYNLLSSEIELVEIVRKNLNTEAGYQAFYKLEKSIIDRVGDQAILYDLAADFNWDNKLEEALKRIEAKDHA